MGRKTAKLLDDHRTDSSNSWALFTAIVVIYIYTFVLIEGHLEIFNSLLLDIISFQKSRILSPTFFFFLSYLGQGESVHIFTMLYVQTIQCSDSRHTCTEFIQGSLREGVPLTWYVCRIREKWTFRQGSDHNSKINHAWIAIEKHSEMLK